MAEWKLMAVCPHGYTETIYIADNGTYMRLPKTCQHLQPVEKKESTRKAIRKFRKQLRKL